MNHKKYPCHYITKKYFNTTYFIPYIWNYKPVYNTKNIFIRSKL